MTKNKDRKKIYQKDNPIIHNKDFQKINNIEKKNSTIQNTTSFKQYPTKMVQSGL